MARKKLKIISACINLGAFLIIAALMILVFVLEMKELEYYIEKTQDTSAGWLALLLIIILILVAIPLGVCSIFLLVSFIGLFASKKGGKGFLIVGIIGKILSVLVLAFLLALLISEGAPGFVSKTIYTIVALALLASAIFDIINGKKLKNENLMQNTQL